MTFEYIAEESISYEPPDPNTLTPETSPEDGKPEEPEKKPEEPEEKQPEGAKPEKPEEPEKKAELPKGVQKRINKLTARNYGLKKEIAEREKRIAELEAIAGQQNLTEEIAEHAKTKPNKAEFESYEDYLEAKSKWDVRATMLDREKEKAPKPEEKKKEDPSESTEEIFKAGREAYEDFEEIVQNPSLKLSETMFLASMESDLAHEILYHLGSNPDEAAKIYALTPLQQAREIGKLETKLAKENPEPKVEKEEKVLDVSEQRKPQQEETKKTTKAPPPIESVHGKSVTRKDPEKMSNEEFREYRGYDKRGWKKG